jgi:hypothetical protein
MPIPAPSLSVGVEEIEARWRPLTTAESAIASQLLVDAELLVNTRFPTLAAALDDTVDWTLYAAVIVAMVVRVIRNPDGFTSETVGDWSGARDAEAARAQLYLAEDEATLLSEALGLGSTGAFTITPYYVDDSTATIEL